MLISNDEKGFTLTEILASVVILFLVLITFFAIFTQSSLFTHKNDESITADSLVEQVSQVIRSGDLQSIQPLDTRSKSLLGVDNSLHFLNNAKFSLQLIPIDQAGSQSLQTVKINILDQQQQVIATSYCYLDQTR
ncbi:hypothetical protein CN692_23200 [Bacillus sp. AFS002410]|uniref:type IV pilus modification PilV family protein n=1 Tax=Bacillus sp. AFS002410 TaxID=2033481 RepID=UPI000BF2347D|nr:prepilin-type N-terminal cleavage/methylation domain-containing protein [Bacillus sp. AFS002410]PEJ49355.1 hypothetical protein CN692_23200 [Bacillus sp. AFS002410]